jgi:hypothetical protein
MDKTLASVFVLLFVPALALAQIKVSTVSDESTPSSKAVMTDLRSKIASHPKQFMLVSNTKDSYPGVLVMADCLPQKEKTGAFVCYYTSHFVGGTSKSFMGGGIYLAATSDEVADSFLASIAQDIVEQWNPMIRLNAIDSLEACLELTQSSCKVPEPLEPELKAKIINLSQYLQKGGLKK